MAKKAKRHWPDHPLVGRKVTYKKDGVEDAVEIVDVKAGPMFLDTSAGWLDKPEAKIFSSILLRLRHISTDAEFWSPPMKWDEKTGALNSDAAEAVAHA